ncbi:MAG: DUF4340 domain-containing protein, partial [Gammaproteobacteria bacterium]|nr:DUF4340 domain-containing protein [Gammaproteobacteria bacterium]
MTNRTVQILAATIVGLILLLLVTRDDNEKTIYAGGLLLPEFKAVANDVTNISITRASDSESLEIRSDGDRWVVTDRDDYPADIGVIRQLIIALAEANIVEEKTANPENYDRLGVADPGPDSTGTRVVVAGDDFSYSVILGNEAQGDFRYARVTDQQTSFLIDQNPDLPTSIGGWLTDEVIDLPAAKIRSVAISHADGETLVIEKNEEAQTDFAVLDIPDGRELSYATVANGIGGALTSLTLQDARAAVDAEPAASVVFETWDGLTVTADIITEDDETWISFAAEAATEASDAADDSENPDADSADTEPAPQEV